MKIVDYYINTIDDMQNEKYFFYHCKKFAYNHDFERFFGKIVHALLIFVILDSNVYLFLNWESILLIIIIDVLITSFSPS